jgi:hypothetical protein
MALSGTTFPCAARIYTSFKFTGDCQYFGSTSKHNVVLVDGGIHGGNLGLAEGFVERVVEHLRGNAEARSGGAVIGKPGLKTAVLLVGIDVGEQANFSHLLEQDRAPLHEIL